MTLAAAAFIFRFAPSPNGRLHLGHAYSALLNAKLAARLHGRFLLRLEDIDSTRCTTALAQHCLDDLAWLGLTWETPVRAQSEHGEDYAAALAALKKRGLVYPCFCTRREVAEASTQCDPDGAPLYPGTCKRLSAGEVAQRLAANTPHSWRLDMDKALVAAPGPHYYLRFAPDSMQEESVTANPTRWGDAVLARKDIALPTSYHLSVVVDDALQSITHVVRGADLEAATDLHVLLQTLLGLKTPLYHHHALIEKNGDKLAKSKGGESLEDLRARGVTAREVREMVGM